MRRVVVASPGLDDARPFAAGVPHQAAVTSGVLLALGGLFASSFLSATVLPGNSEAALLAFLAYAPQWSPTALAVATVGNTAGGLTTYVLGRLLPAPPTTRAVAWLQRAGPAALLLSWLPLVGDGLCLASGWLRQNMVAATVFMAIGKLARYWVLAEGFARFAAT